MSYSKSCDTFGAADCAAVGTGLGSPSFVGFDVARSVLSSLVFELAAQHRPARVEDGLRHLGLREFGRADISDDDKFVLASELGAPLVEMVAPGVGDLGVDRADAALVSGALRNSKRGFVLAVVAECRDRSPVAACGKRLESEINANLAVAGRAILGNLALEADVPATPSVLHEAPGLKLTVDVARLPEVELALEVDDVRAVDFHGTRDERNPTECALRATAGSPTQVATIGVALRRVLAADGLHGVGVQAEISSGSRAKLHEVECARPLADATRPPASLGLALDSVAVVPDVVHRARMSVEVLPDRRVLDTVFERQHRHGLFPPVQRGCKALDALGFEYLSAGAPLKPMHSRMWVGANRRFKLWVISKADAKIGALTDVEHFPGFGKEKVDRSHGRKHVTARQRQRREQEWLYAFWRHATQAGFKRSDVRAQNFALALPVLLRVRRQKLGFRFRDANSDGAFVCHPLYVLRIAVHCKWSPSYFAASCGGAPITIVKRYVEQQRQASR